MNLNEVNTSWTDERILDLVRKLRNHLVKDFLDEPFLKSYLTRRFGIHNLSNVKALLIRNDLRMLLTAPVDTEHYQDLIDQIRETDTAGISETHETLFYHELEAVFKRYLYLPDDC